MDSRAARLRQWFSHQQYLLKAMVSATVLAMASVTVMASVMATASVTVQAMASAMVTAMASVTVQAMANAMAMDLRVKASARVNNPAIDQR